jgi:hypothetical protein
MRFLGTVARKGAKQSELMMKVNTWLPAIRYVDPMLIVEPTSVVDVIPYSSTDAKSLTFMPRGFNRDGLSAEFDRFEVRPRFVRKRTKSLKHYKHSIFHP